MVDSIASLAPRAMEPAAVKDNPAKVHDAAQQFEALLIGELLKSARSGGGSGWLGTGEEDDAGQTAVDMAEQQFARMLATSGGLGMSKLIETGIRQRADQNGAAQNSTAPNGTAQNRE